MLSQIKSESKSAHLQKLAICKKSTILVLFLQNLVKMITSWVEYFHQVSWGLEKNCGFFTYGQFWVCLFFFYSDFRMFPRLNDELYPIKTLNLYLLPPKEICNKSHSPSILGSLSNHMKKMWLNYELRLTAWMKNN